jgi:hypothetical protein
MLGVILVVALLGYVVLSVPERGQLGAKAAPGQLRQHLRVGGPANQRIEHRPS